MMTILPIEQNQKNEVVQPLASFLQWSLTGYINHIEWPILYSTADGQQNYLNDISWEFFIYVAFLGQFFPY